MSSYSEIYKLFYSRSLVDFRVRGLLLDEDHSESGDQGFLKILMLWNIISSSHVTQPKTIFNNIN